MHWDGGGGGWVLVSLSMVVFWTVLVAAVVVGARSLAQWTSDQSHPTSSAQRVLEERFARGEIDRREFEERRAALSNS